LLTSLRRNANGCAGGVVDDGGAAEEAGVRSEARDDREPVRDARLSVAVPKIPVCLGEFLERERVGPSPTFERSRVRLSTPAGHRAKDRRPGS
jgi:hypothetical protein